MSERITITPPHGLQSPECVERLMTARQRLAELDVHASTLLRQVQSTPRLIDMIEQEDEWLAESIRANITERGSVFGAYLRALAGEQ